MILTKSFYFCCLDSRATCIELQLIVVTTMPINNERRLNQPSAISVIRMQILITRTIGSFVSAKRAEVYVNEKD